MTVKMTNAKVSIRVPVKGFIAFIKRLLKIESGWEYKFVGSADVNTAYACNAGMTDQELKEIRKEDE